MENLWPAFEKRDITTPRAVFEKQVEFFNSLDTGLRALLTSGLDANSNLTYLFRIQASALSGYTFSLFRALHHANYLYPVHINDYIREQKHQIEDQ